MEIAQTSNVDLLVISGMPTEKEIQDCWEIIVKRNSEQNGLRVDDHFDNIKTYGRLLHDYILVKLSLMQLMMVVDDDAIMFVESKGYKITTIGPNVNDAYRESIQAAMQKCKNIITKLKTRYNQIQQVQKGHEEGKKVQSSIEEILANLSAAMGYSIDNYITLARYNEYKNILKRKEEASKMNKKAA